jgi:hypothetical protein
MATEAFVTACRGPADEPAEISPLSYLLTAIANMGDLETMIVYRDKDPDAYWLMVAGLRSLYLKLKAALAEHDEAAKRHDRDEAERHINMLYGCPGAQYESDTGEELLHATLGKFGLAAFTDEFLADLARQHRLEDEAAGNRAEADYRRSLRRPSISEPF